MAMMYSYGDGWAWWQMSLMWVGIVAFWGMLIWGVYLLATHSSHAVEGAPLIASCR